MKDLIPNIGERVEISSHFVPKANSLLDVGCGDGILMYFVKNKVNKIYGIDSDLNELKKARKRGMLVKRTDLNTKGIPFNKETFDVITCLDVIEHVQDPRFLLSEIKRTLKKNGLLILTTPNIRFTNHLIKLVVNGVFPKTSEDPLLYDGGHVHFFTYKDISNLLKNEGFSVISETGIINKPRRGWKGRTLQFFLGTRIMNEFRSPGILTVAKK